MSTNNIGSAITQISKIQLRHGNKEDLPEPLSQAEPGWCIDTNELYIGNTYPTEKNVQVLTVTDPKEGTSIVPASGVVATKKIKITINGVPYYLLAVPA